MSDYKCINCIWFEVCDRSQDEKTRFPICQDFEEITEK